MSGSAYTRSSRKYATLVKQHLHDLQSSDEVSHREHAMVGALLHDVHFAGGVRALETASKIGVSLKSLTESSVQHYEAILKILEERVLGFSWAAILLEKDMASASLGKAYDYIRELLDSGLEQLSDSALSLLSRLGSMLLPALEWLTSVTLELGASIRDAIHSAIAEIIAFVRMFDAEYESDDEASTSRISNYLVNAAKWSGGKLWSLMSGVVRGVSRLAIHLVKLTMRVFGRIFAKMFSRKHQSAITWCTSLAESVMNRGALFFVNNSDLLVRFDGKTAISLHRLLFTVSLSSQLASDAAFQPPKSVVVHSSSGGDAATQKEGTLQHTAALRGSESILAAIEEVCDSIQQEVFGRKLLDRPELVRELGVEMLPMAQELYGYTEKTRQGEARLASTKALDALTETDFSLCAYAARMLRELLASLPESANAIYAQLCVSMQKACTVLTNVLFSRLGMLEDNARNRDLWRVISATQGGTPDGEVDVDALRQKAERIKSVASAPGVHDPVFEGVASPLLDIAFDNVERSSRDHQRSRFASQDQELSAKAAQRKAFNSSRGYVEQLAKVFTARGDVSEIARRILTSKGLAESQRSVELARSYSQRHTHQVVSDATTLHQVVGSLELYLHDMEKKKDLRPFEGAEQRYDEDLEDDEVFAALSSSRVGDPLKDRLQKDAATADNDLILEDLLSVSGVSLNSRLSSASYMTTSVAKLREEELVDNDHLPETWDQVLEGYALLRKSATTDELRNGLLLIRQMKYLEIMQIIVEGLIAESASVGDSIEDLRAVEELNTMRELIENVVEDAQQRSQIVELMMTYVRRADRARMSSRLLELMNLLIVDNQHTELVTEPTSHLREPFSNFQLTRDLYARKVTYLRMDESMFVLRFNELRKTMAIQDSLQRLHDGDRMIGWATLATVAVTTGGVLWSMGAGKVVDFFRQTYPRGGGQAVSALSEQLEVEAAGGVSLSSLEQAVYKLGEQNLEYLEESAKITEETARELASVLDVSKAASSADVVLYENTNWITRLLWYSDTVKSREFIKSAAFRNLFDTTLGPLTAKLAVLDPSQYDQTVKEAATNLLNSGLYTVRKGEDASSIVVEALTRFSSRIREIQLDSGVFAQEVTKLSDSISFKGVAEIGERANLKLLADYSETQARATIISISREALNDLSLEQSIEVSSRIHREGRGAKAAESALLRILAEWMKAHKNTASVVRVVSHFTAKGVGIVFSDEGVRMALGDYLKPIVKVMATEFLSRTTTFMRLGVLQLAHLDPSKGPGFMEFLRQHTVDWALDTVANYSPAMALYRTVLNDSWLGRTWNMFLGPSSGYLSLISLFDSETGILGSSITELSSSLAVFGLNALLLIGAAFTAGSILNAALTLNNNRRVRAAYKTYSRAGSRPIIGLSHNLFRGTSRLASAAKYATLLLGTMIFGALSLNMMKSGLQLYGVISLIGTAISFAPIVVGVAGALAGGPAAAVAAGGAVGAVSSSASVKAFELANDIKPQIATLPDYMLAANSQTSRFAAALAKLGSGNSDEKTFESFKASLVKLREQHISTLTNHITMNMKQVEDMFSKLKGELDVSSNLDVFLEELPLLLSAPDQEAPTQKALGTFAQFIAFSEQNNKAFESAIKKVRVELETVVRAKRELEARSTTASPSAAAYSSGSSSSAAAPSAASRRTPAAGVPRRSRRLAN